MELETLTNAQARKFVRESGINIGPAFDPHREFSPYFDKFSDFETQYPIGLGELSVLTNSNIGEIAKTFLERYDLFKLFEDNRRKAAERAFSATSVYYQVTCPMLMELHGKIRNES